MQGSLGMPPGHCSAIVMGHGVGVGLGLGVGDGEGGGGDGAPQGNVSMVWQEYGSPFPVKHSMASKMVIRHSALGLLQSAGPTLVCTWQLTQVASRDCVNLVQFAP